MSDKECLSARKEEDLIESKVLFSHLDDTVVKKWKSGAILFLPMYTRTTHLAKCPWEVYANKWNKTRESRRKISSWLSISLKGLLHVRLVCHLPFKLLGWLYYYLVRVILEGGRIAQWLAFTLQTQQPWVRFLAFPKIFSEDLILTEIYSLDVAKFNRQQHCLVISGQCKA